MLKVISRLPESKHFRQIKNRGDRCQWVDLACEDLRILAPVFDPWTQNWSILIRLEQGKTGAGLTYPKRLNLVCFPPEEGTPKAQLIRERWKGNFVHSCEPTLLFFAFPAKSNQEGSSWLMLSVLPE